MSRFRLLPTPEQEQALLAQARAEYAWLRAPSDEQGAAIVSAEVAEYDVGAERNLF